jgi:hypothetical protein
MGEETFEGFVARAGQRMPSVGDSRCDNTKRAPPGGGALVAAGFRRPERISSLALPPRRCGAVLLTARAVNGGAGRHQDLTADCPIGAALRARTRAMSVGIIIRQP